MPSTTTQRRAEAPRGATARPATEQARSARVLRFAGPALLVVAALGTLVWALVVGGGAAPLAIGDPGPFVRWMLPVATMCVNLSAAGMVGALILSLFALRAGEKPFERAMDAASVSAAIFTV